VSRLILIPVSDTCLFLQPFETIRAILERGDTKDPMDLYREFMGRDPSLDALMERAGLLEAA
jgi:hypothetical protein